MNTQEKTVDEKKTVNYRQMLRNSFWDNNPALVQMLGLCPLLAVSNSVVNALGLGLASVFVMTMSSCLVSSSRKIISPEIRIAVFVLIIASMVSICELCIKAFAFGLYQTLGIYLPLIVTNCLIIARAESFAQKNPPKIAAFDGFLMGVGFAIVLIILGAIREIAATGAVFSDMNLMFGEFASSWKLRIFDGKYGNILAALPAGAFIFFGFLVAGKNAIDGRIKARNKAK
ncbi:MAG: electron transport complex subunit E [Cardiobacteriaceae bacterium]|nr:electron transport complex subunit E [Cardiobacteriaceae bacterium]